MDWLCRSRGRRTAAKSCNTAGAGVQLLSENNLAGGEMAWPQEKVKDEWRPGHQDGVKKREGREERDLIERIVEKVGSRK